MSRTKGIRKVAVLGAGVMGAQIAAQFINVGLPVILFDLPSDSDNGKLTDKNSIALKAIENLKKLKPAPLGLSIDADLIHAANYEDNLNLLATCDLIIEAIAERLDWKHALYEKVAPHIPPHAIFATNTSGLPIKELAKGFPSELKKRFCGVHFFNPPRYMHLLEIIPTNDTNPVIVDALETFMTSIMGKGVVRAKDTPNFVGNRVGVFSILAVFAEAQKFGLKFDEVDLITGNKLGRAKSATFRTADVVGLDTLAHVINTMEIALKDDPFAPLFKTPPILDNLIAKGALGQKSKAGFYRKDGKSVLVLDAKTGDYIVSNAKIDPLIEGILKKPITERLGLLRNSDNPQAKFLWAIYRDMFHYCAIHLGSIAESAREIDFAMRWGYGWDMGPFEDWQAAGVMQVANWIKEDIDQGKALSKEPLPTWVFSGLLADQQAFHISDGSWSVTTKKFISRSTLPVYQKQVFRAFLLGDGSSDPRTTGKTIFENPDLRVWVEDGQPDILIASFRSKMNTFSQDVLHGLQKAVEIAEANYDGLIIWQPTSLKLGTPGGPFSAGANLEEAMSMVLKDGPAGVEPFVKLFQDTMMRVKYSLVPVVAAVSGMTLGGGCELVMQSSRRVAAIESYIGLVEVGVGLLPAGGGLKEVAIKVAEGITLAGNANYLDFTKMYFENIAMAKVSSSAQEAIKMGFLQKNDIVTPNVYELLAQAQNQVKAMSYAGYKPPISKPISVGGRSIASTIMGQVINLRDGGFISEHDAFIAKKIIDIITGGDVDTGTLVTEDWLLKLERQAFVELIGHPKTMERIMGLIQNRKIIKN